MTDWMALRFANAALFSSGMSSSIASPPVGAASPASLSPLSSPPSSPIPTDSVFADASISLYSLPSSLPLSVPLSSSSLSPSSSSALCISSSMSSLIPTFPPSSSVSKVSLMLTTFKRSLAPTFVIWLFPRSTTFNASLSKRALASSVAPLSEMALNLNRSELTLALAELSTLNRVVAPASPIKFPLRFISFRVEFWVRLSASAATPASPTLLSSRLSVSSVLL
mmetsp:Transcript_37931/g.81031  ORF Transcript_37931/g.81031 Transcript_37931/m.81031 type:complete len:224 (-) Transcript_37931:490-1161(-)